MIKFVIKGKKNPPKEDRNEVLRTGCTRHAHHAGRDCRAD